MSSPLIPMATMLTDYTPLYPHHGKVYDDAMESAREMYIASLTDSQLLQGIRLYRRGVPTESPAAADFSEIDVNIAETFE